MGRSFAPGMNGETEAERGYFLSQPPCWYAVDLGLSFQTRDWSSEHYPPCFVFRPLSLVFIFSLNYDFLKRCVGCLDLCHIVKWFA